MQSPAPTLANIRIHPIKSLDPVSVTEARISPSGGLALDRAWALHSADGKWVNGKRTPLIHHIRANYSPDLRSVTLSVPADRRKIPSRTFAFPEAHEEAAEWFSVFFEQQIIVRYSEGGFPDDPVANGPTIVSTASLQAVCEWFTLRDAKQAEGFTLGDASRPEGFTLHNQNTCHSERSLRSEELCAIARSSRDESLLRGAPDHRGGSASHYPEPTLDNVRERFRTTLEIDGVPAFWEDCLFFANERNVVRFTIGEVHFEGSNPCARCPVPPRDPRTGLAIDGFQKRFTQLRESTLPPWSPRDRFDHFYRFATNTRVPSSESGRLLRIGAPLILANP